jgi:hypothetical protein
MPSHFKTLRKSRSINTPSGQLAWEAVEYTVYTPCRQKVLTGFIVGSCKGSTFRWSTWNSGYMSSLYRTKNIFSSNMNNNQHDALFIFSLLSYHTSTCLAHISSPSSGGRMYICGKWCLLYCWVDGLCAWPGPMTVSSAVQVPFATYIHSTSLW